MTNSYSAISLIIRRSIYLVILTTSIILLTIPSVTPAEAQESVQQSLPDFTLNLSNEEVTFEDEVELNILATNPRTEPIEDFEFNLYATEGLRLASNPNEPHMLYEPLITETIDLLPGQSEQMVILLYVTDSAKAPEGVGLFNQEGIKLARLEVPVSGAPEAPEDDYNMPVPPDVTCGAVPPLSQIGGAVHQAINGGYYSDHTWCNKFTGDWILDVPNVTTTTTPTSAEDFYSMVADMIRYDTDHIFSMSTLTFDTTNADEDGDYPERNLVKHYLGTAIRDLHVSTPVNTPYYPLLRFAYSPGIITDTSCLQIPPNPLDLISSVYDDLTEKLSQYEPDSDQWRVSIAVAGIGNIPISPWNHSKIAVSDYRHAIVGGMNWELNYILPVDYDGHCEDYGHDEIIEINGTPYNNDRLYDLSLQVEGEAAKSAGVYFDLLWRRNIDPLFPHLGLGCKVSWSWPIWNGWDHDCVLENVPAYALPAGIPPYSISEELTVFGLGRGHVGFGNGTSVDKSADDAILAAFDEAQQTIYISQHKLTGIPNSSPLNFSPEVKQAIIDAAIRGVHLKIALSEAWGGGTLDSSLDVYNALENDLWAAAVANWPSPYDWRDRQDALCRLEFGPFRVPPNDSNDLYFTHNKFFMVDDKVFYTGSQNLYPSAIGSSVPDPIVPDLNEYGFLIDNLGLTTQMKNDYWDVIWDTTLPWVYQPPHQVDDVVCFDGHMVEVDAVILLWWNAAGDGSNQIKISWETGAEILSLGFNIYRSETDDFQDAIKANPYLIPCQVCSGPGAIYEWVDTTAVDGIFYYYWLEEVGANGTFEIWGPKTTITGLYPDLTIESIATRPSGNDEAIYLTVKNIGLGVAEDFGVGIYYGGNEDIICVTSLEPGQSSSVLFTVSQSVTGFLPTVNPSDEWVSPPPECSEIILETDYNNNDPGSQGIPTSCPPSLALPLDSAVIEGSEYLLWGECSGALTYDLKIKKLSTNQNMTIGNLSNPQFRPGVSIPGNFIQARQQYVWRVRSCSSPGTCSNWSDTRVFWWEEGPPEIVSVYPPLLATDENTPKPFKITIQVTDPDTPAGSLVWDMENIGGTDISGMTLSSDGHFGTITWSPTEAQGPSTNTVKVTISDGVDVTEEILTIYVYELNQPPAMNRIGNQFVVEGQELSFTVSATDPDVPTNVLEYQFYGTPPISATLSSVSGEFNWVPQYDQTGLHIVRIGVSDGIITNSMPVYITVRPLYESIVAYGQYWNYDSDSHDLVSTGILTDVYRYAEGPCFDQVTCTFDTRTISPYGTNIVSIEWSKPLQIESIMAYGQYWDFNAESTQLLATGSLLDIGRYTEIQNPPCQGQQVCTFDTRTITPYAIGDSTFQSNTIPIESITAYGQYWDYDMETGALLYTGSLAEVERYDAGPCAENEEICVIDTRDVYVQVDTATGEETLVEFIVAYGQYWTYEVETQNLITTGNLDEIDHYAQGPCFGQDICTLNLVTVTPYAISESGIFPAP